jgi:acyl carrier protein
MSKENQLLEIVAEILELEIDEVTLETELDEANWDSLAVVSFIAEADSEFGKILSPKDVSSVESVKGLLELI